MRLLVRGFSHHVTGKSVLHGSVSVSDAADTGDCRAQTPFRQH